MRCFLERPVSRVEKRSDLRNVAARQLSTDVVVPLGLVVQEDGKSAVVAEAMKADCRLDRLVAAPHDQAGAAITSLAGLIAVRRRPQPSVPLSELPAECPVLQCGEQLVVGIEGLSNAVALDASRFDLRRE